MLKTKQKGIVTELECINYLAKIGCVISIPYGENSAYDFIVDTGLALLKIQCKTSSEKSNGTIIFSCRRTRVNTKRTISRKYSEKEIDYFCTFFKERCYLVPISECSSNKKLRFLDAGNSQQKGINYAEDYVAEKQIEKLHRTLEN